MPIKKIKNTARSQNKKQKKKIKSDTNLANKAVLVETFEIRKSYTIQIRTRSPLWRTRLHGNKE